MAHPAAAMVLRPPLRRRWLALGAGMLAQASVSSLQQGLPALGPLLRETYDLTLPELGALLASAGWGVMLTMYLWGLLADRLGERMVVAAGLGGAVVALCVATMMTSALHLGLAIAAAGAMSGAAIAASGRAVMGWFPQAERGLALGLRQMAVPLGAGFSALVLPWVALRHGPQSGFVALAALAMLGAIAAVVGLKSPRTGGANAGTTAPASSPPAISPLRDRAIWRLSTASGLLHWAQAATNAFLVIILVERQGLSYGAAVALFATVQLLSGCLRVLAGWVSDRRGHRIPHLMAFAIGITLVLGIGALLQLGQSWLGCAVLVMATVLAAAWNGLAIAGVAELAGHARAGSALGLHGTVLRVMTIPTTLLFGLLAGQAGWTAALAALAVFPAAGAVLLVPVVKDEKQRQQALSAG